MTDKLTGTHVFAGMAAGFGIIIAVNVTLAVQAIATFPGLETRNAYVASQRFEAERDAQERLGWQAALTYDGDVLRLAVTDAAGPVLPRIESAVLGRATHVSADRDPQFVAVGDMMEAGIALTPGNWNLRLVARAEDGTPFRRRFALRVPG
jgi:nitrogen fixation protein FixH